MRTIVTGAAGGIGEAVARLHARRYGGKSSNLFLVDRDSDRLNAVADELGAIAFAADLEQEGAGEAIVRAAVQGLGGIDAIVSNAGIIHQSPLAKLSTSDFDRIFAINTRATWLLAKAAYPELCMTRGTIVATGSISAFHPTPPLGAYAASKAALLMLMRQMANEWGPDGIRCNTVSPGPTMTGMTQAGYSDEDLRRRREASLPLRHIGEPEDIASAILFLLSPEARQITGTDLLVDAGLSTTLMSGSGTGSGHQVGP